MSKFKESDLSKHYQTEVQPIDTMCPYSDLMALKGGDVPLEGQ